MLAISILQHFKPLLLNRLFSTILHFTHGEMGVRVAHVLGETVDPVRLRAPPNLKCLAGSSVLLTVWNGKKKQKKSIF